MSEDTQDKLCQVYESMKDLSLYKNKMYNDSALTPKNIFSKLGADEQIRVRLDDKLSRIISSKDLRKNDVSDIMGYIALLCVSHDWLNFDEFKD